MSRSLALVLASASPRRRAILERLGYPFAVDPADVDETPPPGMPARWIAEVLATRKLRAVARRVESGVVIAADTIVVVNGELLGKPADAADAARMLERLSGSTHEVITGVALGAVPSGHERIASATTIVTMRRLERSEIDAYVASGEPFGKAGGYAIQETADRFVVRLDGGFDNVVGFPSDLFPRMLDGLVSMVRESEGER